MIYELIGYAASILVAVSLMMRSILRLRIINLIGAALFTIYGLLIGAYPVAAVNFVIVIIDLYYLYGIVTAEEYFRLLEVQPESDYLHYFLDFHAADIQEFLPGFAFDPADAQIIFFVLRDLVPAGLFIAERRSAGTISVDLDFVIPGYRDFKVGRYLYSRQRDFFLERGIRTIYTRSGNETHARYLERMGFEPCTEEEEEQLYCLHLTSGS